MWYRLNLLAQWRAWRQWRRDIVQIERDTHEFMHRHNFTDSHYGEYLCRRYGCPDNPD